jgi:UDP-sulfoquinovose synthase
VILARRRADVTEGYAMARVLVLGGDGFCGWPTALHLSAHGYEVGIVDDFSRRRLEAELGIASLPAIAPMDARLAAWQAVSGQDIEFFEVDVAGDYRDLLAVIDTFLPGTIVHCAEQRPASHAMSNATRKRYTVNNNVSGTHNVLVALVEARHDIHLVHLGATTGYSDDAGFAFSTDPGSVHDLTKSLDQLLFEYYVRNDDLRISDLQLGMVGGSQTEETRRHAALVNRFPMQGVVDHALAGDGSRGQTPPFIHIQEMVRCVRRAVDEPPRHGDPVKVLNPPAEQKVPDKALERLAQLWQRL